MSNRISVLMPQVLCVAGGLLLGYFFGVKHATPPPPSTPWRTVKSASSGAGNVGVPASIAREIEPQRSPNTEGPVQAMPARVPTSGSPSSRNWEQELARPAMLAKSAARNWRPQITEEYTAVFQELGLPGNVAEQLIDDMGHMMEAKFQLTYAQSLLDQGRHNVLQEIRRTLGEEAAEKLQNYEAAATRRIEEKRLAETIAASGLTLSADQVAVAAGAIQAEKAYTPETTLVLTGPFQQPPPEKGGTREQFAIMLQAEIDELAAKAGLVDQRLASGGADENTRLAVQNHYRASINAMAVRAESLKGPSARVQQFLKDRGLPIENVRNAGPTVK